MEKIELTEYNYEKSLIKKHIDAIADFIIANCMDDTSTYTVETETQLAEHLVDQTTDIIYTLVTNKINSLRFERLFEEVIEDQVDHFFNNTSKKILEAGTEEAIENALSNCSRFAMRYLDEN